MLLLKAMPRILVLLLHSQGFVAYVMVLTSVTMSHKKVKKDDS